MIAAPSPRAIAPSAARDGRVCPACRSCLDRDELAWACDGCGRMYPDVAGIADLRLSPDRYLSLDADRAKARHLATLAPQASFDGLARAYYDTTDDVDATRARRYVAHLASAEVRGEAFVDLLPKTGRVLEVGCGSGGLIAAAARRGLRIEAVDIASRWLVLAHRRAGPVLLNQERLHLPSPSRRLTAANAEHLPWPDATFDAVFADSLVEHLDEVPATLREWHRVAKPGASLIMISPNRSSLLPDPHVGLLGVGWLPQRWQGPYVRWRRGCGWPVRLRSAREVARLVKAAGWTVRRVAAAPAPGPGFSLYDAARRIPFVSDFLRRFGPLWLVEAVREGSS